jgi:hypothetical protein
MKKNDVITNVIIIPLVLGLVFGIAFFLFFKANTDIVLPVNDGTVFAYHDQRSSSSDVVDKSSLDELVSNDNIGTLTTGKTTLNVKYDADYSNTVGSVSLNDNGCRFGDVGYTYLYAYSGDIKAIDTDDVLSVDSIFGKYKYEYVEQYTANSEYELLSDSPKVKKGLVIYYCESDGAGLSSKYKALVFEEVE